MVIGASLHTALSSSASCYDDRRVSAVSFHAKVVVLDVMIGRCHQRDCFKLFFTFGAAAVCKPHFKIFDENNWLCQSFIGLCQLTFVSLSALQCNSANVFSEMAAIMYVSLHLDEV